MPKKLDNDTIQKIINMYTTENITLEEVAKRLNIHTTKVISKYLRLNGIKIKNRTDLTRTQNVIEQVLTLHKDGNTIEKISNIVKVSYPTIVGILRDNNIETCVHTRYRKYFVDENYFEHLDTMNKCYVLGFLYSDGTIGNEKSNRLQLVLQERDKEILEKIREDMKFTGPLHFRNSSKNNEKEGRCVQDTWGLEIVSKKIRIDLAKLGMEPNKTFKIKYPDFITENQHSHFLRGVLDGDGHITPYNGHMAEVIICGTYDLCQGAKRVVESLLNIRCYVHSVGNIYNFCVYGKNQVTTFLNWIYKDAEMYLQRKYDRYMTDYYTNNSLSA